MLNTILLITYIVGFIISSIILRITYLSEKTSEDDKYMIGSIDSFIITFWPVAIIFIGILFLLEFLFKIIDFVYYKFKKDSPCKSCLTCKFNQDYYCNVGDYYADKGINTFCYSGELWEEKENK